MAFSNWLAGLFAKLRGVDRTNSSVKANDYPPATFEDEALGTLVYEPEYKWISVAANWKGVAIKLFTNAIEGKPDPEALQHLKEFWTDFEKWDARIRTYAADEMHENANEWSISGLEPDEYDAWQDAGGDNKPLVTKESFIERMKLQSIDVGRDRSFVVDFEDDQMFAGHSIVVEGNMNTGPDNAYIAG